MVSQRTCPEETMLTPQNIRDHRWTALITTTPLPREADLKVPLPFFVLVGLFETSKAVARTSQEFARDWMAMVRGRCLGGEL